MMKAQDLAVIALKLLGLYLLIQFVVSLPMLISFAQRSNSFAAGDGDLGSAMTGMMNAVTVGTLLTVVSYLVAGISLLAGAGRMARFVVPNPDAQLSLSGTISDDVTRFAFRGFGLYALITWLPTFVQLVIQCAIQASQDHLPMTPLQGFYAHYSSLLAPASGTVCGLFLFIRPCGLLNLLRLSQKMTRERLATKQSDDPQ
jgi:hypothetical protein